VRGVVIDSIAKDQAADEETLTITGLELERVTRVLAGALELPIVSQSPTELVLRPARRDPSFTDLTLETAEGTLLLPGALESLPSLVAHSTGLAGRLEIELTNGVAGAYVLFYSLDLRPQPLVVLDPPTWYTLRLRNLPGRFGVLETNAFTNAGVAELVYALPNDPGLVGQAFHVQAWCQRGILGPQRYSFTNAVTLSF
jgi:hypothetical protein